MGEWDVDAVRRLFTSLEFRTLFERLRSWRRSPKPKVEVAELDLREWTPEELGRAPGRRPRRRGDRDRGGRRARRRRRLGRRRAGRLRRPVAGPGPVADGPWPTATPKWTHDAKALETRRAPRGSECSTAWRSTRCWPATCSTRRTRRLPRARSSEQYLGTDLFGADEEAAEEAEGQLFTEDAWRRVRGRGRGDRAARAGPGRADREGRGCGRSSRTWSCRSPPSSPGCRRAGVALDVPYLEEMAERVRDRMATLHAEIYRHAGRGVQPELAAAAPGDPLRQARPLPGQEDAEGPALDRRERPREAPRRPSDRRRAPVVAGARQAELDVPRGAADARSTRSDGRVHTTFNQTGAATGRLSSSNPNLQNIPIRGELGRQIRRAFVPGGDDQILLVADYSQIELRILAHLSGDEGLREAFDSGLDIHTATAATVFDLPPEQVDAEMRRRAKAVNYGLAYGMNAWGLATRLGITRRRGAGVHRRLLRGLPGDPGLPRQPGGPRRPRRGSPRRSSAGAATSPSSRPRTLGSATSGAGWR